MEVSNLFVCLMGMGVTFIGLACLTLLTAVLGKFAKSGVEETKTAPAPAALAEELGTDVSGIRILSFKKVS